MNFRQLLPLIASIAASFAMVLIASWPSVKGRFDPDARQLRAIFSVHEDGKEDCRDLSTFSLIMADAVKRDGRYKENLRKYKTDQELHRARMQFNAELFETPLSELYSDLGPFLGEYFKRRLGEQNQPLDQHRRALWVKAFRDLSDSTWEAAR